MATDLVPRYFLAIGLSLVACTEPEANPSWVMETTDCELATSATIGGEPALWVDCRAFWSGLPFEILTVELLTAATTGSFIAPGPGWLSFSVSGKAPENATLVVDDTQASQVPVSVPEHAISIYYFTPDSDTGFPTKVLAEGSVDVGSNLIDVSSSPSVSFSAVLEGVVLRPSANERIPLGGEIRIAAAKPRPPEGNAGDVGGNGPTSGCSAGDSSSCDVSLAQCAGNPTAQAACYCAAACVCHYACDPSCEQPNRASAAALGTTCSY
jgi:hypothetical protein